MCVWCMRGVLRLRRVGQGGRGIVGGARLRRLGGLGCTIAPPAHNTGTQPGDQRDGKLYARTQHQVRRSQVTLHSSQPGVGPRGGRPALRYGWGREADRSSDCVRKAREGSPLALGG